MRRVSLYLTMTAGAVGVYYLVQTLGQQLGFQQTFYSAQDANTAGNGRLVHVLLSLAAIIVLARLVGLAFRRIAQPPVIGEIVAGILLGPSFLGRLAPGASAFLLPGDIIPYLKMIADVGVIIYMFLIGVDLNKSHLRERTRSSIAVSHTSIVVPFVLGLVLALWLYPRWAPHAMGFGPFSLFIGVSMSVTAFPVLARILTDRELHTTQLGAIALACAAVDDVTAWCLLALLVGSVHAQSGALLVILTLAISFIAVVLWVFRPMAMRLARLCEREGFGQGLFTVVCVTVLVSAVAAESIGIHALFGAFLVGVTIPHESRLAQELQTRLKDVVVVLLLPAFFAFTGMRTQLDLLDGWSQWCACLAIIVVATCGKLGGSALAARMTGLTWKHSLALGALLNTRGLMELIVLNVGLDLGIISPTLFAMFVIMALVTTISATPILAYLSLRHSVFLVEAPHPRQ